MVIAIPTIHQNKISQRFGQLTEITFVTIKNNEVIEQRFDPVSKHSCGKHSDGEHSPSEKQECTNRKQEIIDKICSADLILYKSLCKNWRARLQGCTTPVQRTNNDSLTNIIAELTRV